MVRRQSEAEIRHEVVLKASQGGDVGGQQERRRGGGGADSAEAAARRGVSGTRDAGVQRHREGTVTHSFKLCLAHVRSGQGLPGSWVASLLLLSLQV